jgi:hypothetical protein
LALAEWKALSAAASISTILPAVVISPGVHVFHLVKRDDFADFEELPRIPRRDFKYRAVAAAAGRLNGRVRDIELGSGPARICRF